MTLLLGLMSSLGLWSSSLPGTVEKFTALAQQEAVCRSWAGEWPPLQCSRAAGDEQAETQVVQWELEHKASAALVLMGSLCGVGDSGFHRGRLQGGRGRALGWGSLSRVLIPTPWTQAAARDSGRSLSSCGDPPVTLEHYSL